MSAGTAWAAFDPSTPALTIVEPSSQPGDKHNMVSGLPFWHPNHELFGFAVLLGLTAAALYVVNEKASIGAHAGVGPVKGEAELEV
jgi:hypothetical protein